MNIPAAIIFDFDGVLVDSEKLHCQTMAEAMGADGPPLDWETYQTSLIGFDDRGAFAWLLERAGVEPTPEEVRRRVENKAGRFARYAAEGRVAAMPGAVEFARACAAAYPLALCSGALRSDIEPVLAGIGLEEVFPIRVTADDVPRSKPDPAGYVLALERLAERHPEAGIAAKTCLAIEDTVDGITSALGAGIVTLGVASYLPPGRLLQAGAIAVVDTFKGLGPGFLAMLLQ